MLNRTLVAVAAIFASSMLAGCAPGGAEDVGDGEKSSQKGAAALSGDDSVSRAMEWVYAAMPYCGAPNRQYDSLLCGITCNRDGAADNAAWNPYRSDCSGLVSWAWGLSAPGQTTWGLDSMTKAIPTSSLVPGDILITSGHVVLFAGWTNMSAGAATIIHEGDCGQVAKTVPVSIQVGDNSTFAMWGSTYTAKRWEGVVSGGGGTADNCNGVDYNGYCDGNAVVWCENGQLKQKDCNASGRVCGYESAQVGYNCMTGGGGGTSAPPADSCNGVSYIGYCDANSVVWCEGGALKQKDCSSTGRTCVYQDDSIGYNCM
jgi:hypothetical protein